MCLVCCVCFCVCRFAKRVRVVCLRISVVLYDVFVVCVVCCVCACGVECACGLLLVPSVKLSVFFARFCVLICV